MRRVVIAVVLGGLVGLALTWLFVTERAVDGPPAAAAAPLQADPRVGEALVLPRVEDRDRPGLWISVRDTGRVVAGARVEVWRQLHDEAKGGVRWIPVGQELSDEQGAARFPAPVGRYALRATRSGRTALAEVDVVIADEPTVAEVTLGPGRPLTGRVVDKDTTAPIPGALVTAAASSPGGLDKPWRFPQETHVTAQADGLGRFRVELPEGVEVSLQAQAPGYARTDSFPGDDSTDVTLQLVRAVRVEGVVVDTTGNPLAGATVDSEPPESPPTATGADGRFSITLRPGAATLHATSTGGLQGLRRVQAAAGEHLRDVRLVVGASGDLLGRVVDAAGDGVSGVEVRVLAEPDFVPLATLQTDARGAFTAVKLPAARVALFARSGNGARARLVGLELPVQEPVQLTLAASAAIDGRVVNEAGQPLPNALVALEWSRGLGEPTVRVRTDADGRFRAEDLLPGVVTTYASLGDARSEDVEVYLPASQTASAQLTLIRRGRLKGIVRADKPGRFWIFPDEAGGTPKFRDAFTTDDQGRFDELMLPGRYWVSVTSPSYALARRDAGVEVEIRAGETTELVLTAPTGESDEVPDSVMHPELGTGVSFDTGPGGIAVSFLMSGCPAQKAGLQVGDLLLSIDGAPVTQTLDAFERLKRPRGEVALLTVRRGGQDLNLSVK
ncbi:MAG: carboxypeptidase regulatory-like domain-containing protein [Myxococcota bacterium]